MKKKKKWNLNAKLRSALRQVWRWSPERQQALALARQQRGKYLCASCKKLFGPRDIQVNHKQQVGSVDDLNAYRDRLFCGVDGLEILCRQCHAEVTRLERQRSKEKQ